MAPLLRELFASGRIVDVILLVIAAEFVLLTVRSAPVARRRAMLDSALALAPGACLLLALRAALVGQSWMWVAAWVTASLPIHVADLFRREQASRRRPDA